MFYVEYISIKFKHSVCDLCGKYLEQEAVLTMMYFEIGIRKSQEAEVIVGCMAQIQLHNMAVCVTC